MFISSYSWKSIFLFFNVSVKSFWMSWQPRISHHLGLQIGLAVQIGCLNVHLVLGVGMVIQQRKSRSFVDQPTKMSQVDKIDR